MLGVAEVMAWASDPANLSLVLAVLVGLAFLILALRPRDRFAEETVAAGEPSGFASEPSVRPNHRLLRRRRSRRAFEFSDRQRRREMERGAPRGEYVDADFSDVGGAFQARAEGSKIWGIPVEFHNSKPRLMLRDIDLAGANLTGCDLHYADLRGADLTDACLASAQSARQALLPNARLGDADLRDAKLDNAILSNANLRDANLEGASVEGASFAWADMRGAKGNRSQLEKVADLGGARLANASFDGARARFQIAGRNLLTKKPFVWR